MKRLFLLVVATLAAAPLAAQQAPADAEQTHVVLSGETLWELAQRYLSDPFRWTEIYGVNRDVVADPHWIYPAERLRIPGVGHPGSAARSDAPVDGYVPRPARPVPARTVFFPASAAPEGPGVVMSAADTQDVTVVAPGDYYTAGRLIPDAEVRPVGQLVEIVSASAVPIRLTPQIGPYTRVYMKVSAGQAAQVGIGGVLHLWRAGREIRPYGRIYESTGVVRVVAVEGDVATVEVERLFDSVQLGDLALPVEQFPVPGGVIPRPASGIEGRIIAFADPQAIHSIEDLAYLDLGAQSGVSEGDEFTVLIPARRTDYGIRPEILIGRLQVVRVSGRTSAARVIGQKQPALEAGQVVRLVGKMP
jgi:hypothetical protein